MQSKTSVTLDKELIRDADEAVKKHLVPGVNNRSGLIDYALRKLLQELKEA